MNIRALQYLVTLSEMRHFSKAAEACHVSQPTLSTQVRKIEEELGVQLVERSPRRVMMTQVGEEVVERARAVLNEVEAMRQISRQSRDPGTGVFKIGIFPTLAPYLLPHVIPGIRRRFPKLTLQLFEEKTEDVLRLLGQGRLDAGLVALPIPEELTQLDVQVLFEEHFVLAMPDTHPLARKRRIRVEDLRNQELLLLEDGHCLRDQALEVCQMVGAEEKMDFHATSMETLRQMVAANTGITLMPCLAVKPPVAPTENVTIQAFEDPAPKRTIAMIWRKSTPLSKFFKELADAFQDFDQKLLKP